MDTQDTQFPRSKTLENLGISPKTVCVTCPNAVWYVQATQPKTPVAFCKLFNSVMDIQLTQCDGNPNIPAMLTLAQTELLDELSAMGKDQASQPTVIPQVAMTMAQLMEGMPVPSAPTPD